MSHTNVFTLKEILIPLENSKNKTKFRAIKLGNLNYNSPIDPDFFFGNGNGTLPCVNEKQINFYRYKFKVIPQMRTTDLKDGFYSKKVVKNE